MAGIIKNQLLKHLSRFVKHLSSDRINVSTLKGEGELTNLELDEDVLTDLLALPTWMKIKKASCNRVHIRIPWTRLKSSPIILALDSVYVQIETCEELRKTAMDAANHFASAGKYGFVNKVVDGITLTVESVEMTFHSREFESRVQISRIRVESRSPQWRSGVELSHSRLKDVRRGEVLVFKEVTWQNLRLEAQSTSDRHLAPLRLLTNQAKARIIIKKRLNDCQVVACRLSIILDELLWVLTDSQILAALHFINSLSGLVKQATEESQRIKAKRKLETLPEYQAQQHQATAMNSSAGGGNDAAKIFEAFDIKETSYHFICDKINLHLLDDPGNGRSIHPDLTSGAALQIHFAHIMVDFYPYHLARASRKSWPRYGENQVFNWLKESLDNFNIELMETILPQNEHRPLVRAGPESYVQSPGLPSRSDNNLVRSAVGEKIAKLMSTCLVIRIQNVCIYKVTTSSKESLQPFLSGYMERPKDLHGIHVEFTWFYHPGEICFPLPSSKIYAYLHPIQMDLDTCTVLWLNAFASNLTESLTKMDTATEEPYTDIRLELIQPKILYKCKSYLIQKARPTTLYFQLSRVVLANYRSSNTGTTEQLAQCLESLKIKYSDQSTTKANRDAQLKKLARFYSHCNSEDLVRQNTVYPKKVESFLDLSNLTKEMMWTESRDIWFVRVDSFWSDFCFETVNPKKRATVSRFESMCETGVWANGCGDQLGPPSPFIDPVPITGWIYVPPPSITTSVKENISAKQDVPSKTLSVVLNSTSMCSVQMTHYQYLFLMRMVEAFGELSLYLNLDTEQAIGEEATKAKELFFMMYIPRIEVSFLFPLYPLPSLPRDNSVSDNGTHSSPSPSTDFPTCTPMMQSAVSEPSIAFPTVHQLQPTSIQLPPDRLGTLEIKAKSVNTLETSTKPSTPVGASPVNKPMPTLDMLTDNFKQGMKQGLSTVFAFSKTGGLSTPDSEVASTFSTSGSSDNIQFEHLDLEDAERGVGDGLDENVEVAIEVVEDNEPVVPNFISNGPRTHEYETINALVVQLNDIIVGQEAKGLDSDIRITAGGLEFDELSGIQWQEFQKKFIARSKKWKIDRSSFGATHAGAASTVIANGSNNKGEIVRVHLSQKIDGNVVKVYDWRSDKSDNYVRKSNSGPQKVNLIDNPGGDSIMRKVIIDATQPGLMADVNLGTGQELVLNISSVINLTDLVEDEIIPVPFPFEITVSGGKIKLIEDRPSVNITSPGAPPIKVSIPQIIHVQRDEYGVIYIGEKTLPYVKENPSMNIFDRSMNDLLSLLTLNDEENDNMNGSTDDMYVSVDEKRLKQVNKVIFHMEQKLKELKSEKCNLLLRINCNQTEQIINKKN